MTFSPTSHRHWTVCGRWCAATILALTSVSAGSAQTLTDLDRAIRDATRVIESPASSVADRLDAQAMRGILFRKAGLVDLAIVDLTEVLRIRSGADDLYVERGMAYVAGKQS